MMDEMLHETINRRLNTALTAFGKIVSADYSKFINKYPPELRPVVIGQIEAFVIATKNTFSETEKQISDMVRDNCQIMVIARPRKEEAKDGDV